MNKITYFIFIVSLMYSVAVEAQLSGIKNIPGDYSTIAGAVQALNTQGVSGAVTLQVAAGHKETAPVGGIVLGSATLNQGSLSLNSTRTLTIRKNGTGNNPEIQAFAGGTSESTDGIFKIAGADYVTIDGIDLVENPANTTTLTRMEWGFALVKHRNTAPFDGSQNITITNCTVTLNKANPNSVGIYAGNHTATDTTHLPITAVSDANSNNTIIGNIIKNVRTGVELKGYRAPNGNSTLYDQNNMVGNDKRIGNEIHNFGRSDGAATDKTCGIYLEYQNNSLIAYNEIDNSAAGGNMNSKGELHGIYHGRANNAATKILYNKIKLLQDSTSNQADFFPIRCDIDSGNNASLTVSGNTITAIGGYGKRFAFVFQQGRLFNSEINSNVFQNNTIVAWDFYIMFSDNGTMENGRSNISYNRLSGSNYLKLAGGSGRAPNFHGIYRIGAAAGTSGDTIAHNDITGLFVNNTTANIYRALVNTAGNSAPPYPLKSIHNNRLGYISFPSGSAIQGQGMNLGRLGKSNGQFSSVSENIVSNMRLSGWSGINIETHAGQAADIIGNRIDSSFDNSGNVVGILINALDSSRIMNNVVKDLITTGTNSTVKGITLGDGGIYSVIANNLVADMESPSSSANMSLIGIEITGTAFVNLWHNTVRLSPPPSSATNFSAAGISFNGVPMSVECGNNIVYLNASPKGNGYVAALRRTAGVDGVVPSNLSQNSNNNIWFVDNTNPHTYLYAEGSDTNSLTNKFTVDSSLNTPCHAWKKFMSPGENNSFTEDNLQLTSDGLYAPTGSSYAKNRAVLIQDIAEDIKGTTRPAKADGGIMQFSGTQINAPTSTGFAQVFPPFFPGYCEGDSIRLIAHAYQGLQYQWQKDNQDIAGAHDTSVYVKAAGRYRVIVGSAHCIDTSNVVDIVEYPVPEPTITLGPDNELSTQTGFISYQWHLNDNPISGATNPTHRATTTGDYSVVVTNQSRCSGTSAKTSVTVTESVTNINGIGKYFAFPNPASDKIWIQIPIETDEKIEISLTDATGRILVSQSERVIDISQFSTGIYILSIKNKLGQVLFSEKIIRTE